MTIPPKIAEILHMAFAALGSRLLFLLNLYWLERNSTESLHTYAQLYSLIATGFLFEAANIATVNSSQAGEKTSNHGGALRWILLMNGFFVAAVTVTLALNRSEPNQFRALGCWVAFFLFSTTEAFLILEKKTRTLSTMLLVALGLNAALQVWIFPAFGIDLLSSTLYATMAAYSAASILGLVKLRYLLVRTVRFTLPSILALFRAWSSELTVAIARGAAFIWFTSSISRTQNGAALLATYHPAVQLSFLLAFPFIVGMPIALREQTSWSHRHGGTLAPSPTILRHYLPWSVLPTACLFLLFAALNTGLAAFFFLASAVGQVGHFFALLLRARKQNHLVLLAILVSEIGVQLSVIHYYSIQGPLTEAMIGFSILAFTLSYTLLTAGLAFGRKRLK